MIIGALLLVAGQLAAAQHDSLYTNSWAAMGSTFDVSVYAPNSARAAELFNTAQEEVERIEAALSNYRVTSEVSRLNAQATSTAVTLDPEVYGLITRALDYSRRTGGAFDITVGRLMEAWGFFRRAGQYPDAEALARARAATGYEHVLLDPGKRTVHFRVPLTIDLGGIGKGYAVDRVADLFRVQGVRAALIGAGTSTYYAIGAPPGARGWRIRIADPFSRQAVSVVELRDESLSTSGISEKFFEHNGRRFGHIMDPRTGWPIEARVQVTVIAPRATDSDVLSTASFVLGADASRQLLATAHAAALWIEQPGVGGIKTANWPAPIGAPIPAAVK